MQNAVLRWGLGLYDLLNFVVIPVIYVSRTNVLVSGKSAGRIPGGRDFKDARAVPRSTSIQLSMPTTLWLRLGKVKEFKPI